MKIEFCVLHNTHDGRLDWCEMGVRQMCGKEIALYSLFMPLKGKQVRVGCLGLRQSSRNIQLHLPPSRLGTVGMYCTVLVIQATFGATATWAPGAHLSWRAARKMTNALK